MASKYGYALGAIGVKINDEHYAEIKEKLCYARDPESKAKRDELWKFFDVNDNGLLSLAEVDKGLRDVLGLGDDLFRAKKAIIRAFNAAKNAVQLKGQHADDYVNRCEFRLLLKFLWQYFMLYNAFMGLEEDGDLRLSLEEFQNNHKLIEDIVGEITDPEAEFQNMNPGANGHVLFHDFCIWAYNYSGQGEIDEE